MDGRSASVVSAADPTLDITLVPLSQDPLLLSTNTQILAYVDVLVYEFLGLLQGPTHHRRHVRLNLFHALDKVFRTLYKLDPTHKKEVLFLKKLDTGECSWSTCQVILSLVVETVNMMMYLPNHQSDCLKEILSIAPPHHQ